MNRFIFITLIAALCLSFTPAFAEKYGVYVTVTENVEGTFEDAVAHTENALKNNGWNVLASNSNTVPAGCGFKAHTIVVNSPGYGKQIMTHGPNSSFAVVLRVGIYEDEKGINIAFVNPASLNRTVLGDTEENELSAKTMNTLSEIISGAVKGETVNTQTGQIRKKGKVWGIGGGNFPDMIEELYKKEDTGDAFRETVKKVKEGIEADTKGWSLIYTLEPADGNTVIFGVNKEKMEARAYTIAGEKRASKENTCPGIDHTSAFPIEIIVYKEKGVVKVVILDGMYRMKVYFEDAGRWAFMKNMTMPGQIQDEITSMTLSKLK